ncbi:MAG: signal peptide peptidase SppA [Planctomycetaceae bacterium]|nr:signal peptide peptidase SppA [Planctomycetaceae bacterium]
MMTFRVQWWLALMLFVPALAVGDDAKPAEKKEAPKPDTVAIIRLDKPISDKPGSDDPLFGTAAPEALRDLVQRFHKAADDPQVAAVVVLWGENGLGRGQGAELRQAFDVVKAKKPVYAHADTLTTGGYSVLSAASRISVSPTGDVWITGIYGEQLYLRGLLDLLKVQPDFLTCGEFKSAAETFMRTGPSEQASEMYGWLYDDIFHNMKQDMATGRSVDAAKVDGWINQGLFSAEAAQKSGLIDAVETREDLTDTLKKAFGAAVKFDHGYGRKSGPDIDLNNPFAALQLWAQILGGSEPRRSTRDAVAVVHIDGSISLGNPEVSPFGGSEGAYSEPLRKALDEVAADPRVRAVVLRVNSPGGSATASEIMAQAALRVKSKKPLIVSMGDVAASGGYYVSCEADRIFANPSTVTGSIGVVAGKLATGDMWKQVGIHFHPIQRGEKSGIFGMASPFSDAERDELQAWMDEVYGVFKQHVMNGREKHLSKPLEEMAGGRVFTGKQALELGLVDELGSLEDAIAYAAAQAKVEDYEIRTVPKARNILEQMFEDLSPQKQKDKPRLSLWSAVVPHLDGLDPFHMEMVRDAVRQLDLLREEQVLMTLPVFRIQEALIPTR